MSTPHRWIDLPEQLPEVAAALATAPWIAIDTEANSMFVYRERVCLLQLNIGGELWIIDTLALLRAEGWPGLQPMPVEAGAPPRSTALDPLAAGFARTDRTLWIHGGEYDCALLRRDFGLTLGGLWDTQQAGQFLGFEKTNYGALVERVCAVVLAKGHAQYDWATRPLDPDALTYALDDVVYLPRVGEKLLSEIIAAELIEEHAIACQAVTATSTEGLFDAAGFWRIKGVREVPKENLSVLAAMYVWRDGAGRILDKPPGRVVNNDQLLALARQVPLSFQQLKRMGVKTWVLTEHGETLIEAIRSGKEKSGTHPEAPRHRDVDESEEKREDRLKDWRRSEAEKRNVPLQVVLPAKALDHLKRYGAVDLVNVPQLGAKRLARYGAKLTELCR
jgi:ribonuclease D